MASSATNGLIVGGGKKGLLATADTRARVPFVKRVTVSAAARDTQVTFPDNCWLDSSKSFVTVACSSASQGVKVLLGDGTTDAQYGTTNAIQALGTYSCTISQNAVSAKVITVKVTASVAASAAQFTEGKITVTLIGAMFA